MAKRWTQDEDDQLRDLASEGLTAAQVAGSMNRTESGVRARAGSLGCPFASSARRRVIDHALSGAFLLREDVGGAIGIRWGDAARNEGSFDTAVCERLVSKGMLVSEKDRPNIFKASRDLS